MRPRLMPSTVEELRVPNLRYHYFAEADRLPFRPDLAEFHAGNAWWLAEAAFLSYVPEPGWIAERLFAAGFSTCRMFEKNAHFGMIAETPHWVLVSFRGTNVREIETVLTDLNFFLTEAEGSGRVHRGFQAALDLLWDDMARHLEQVAGDRPVFFTGHSMGAALATLAARRRPRNARLVTFGSPRVGDEEFGRGHGIPTLRIVHHSDFVCFLPPPLRYRHVGEPFVLGEDGGLDTSTRAWDRAKTRGAAILRILLQTRFWETAAAQQILVRNALADHAPVGYAVKLWNLACATSQGSV